MLLLHPELVHGILHTRLGEVEVIIVIGETILQLYYQRRGLIVFDVNEILPDIVQLLGVCDESGTVGAVVHSVVAF